MGQQDQDEHAQSEGREASAAGQRVSPRQVPAPASPPRVTAQSSQVRRPTITTIMKTPARTAARATIPQPRLGSGLAQTVSARPAVQRGAS